MHSFTALESHFDGFMFRYCLELARVSSSIKANECFQSVFSECFRGNLQNKALDQISLTCRRLSKAPLIDFAIKTVRK